MAERIGGNVPAQTNARRNLLLIVAVFALPLVIAWVFTLGPLDWRPAKAVNVGVLLNPAPVLKSYRVMDRSGAALSMDSIAGDWFLVVLHSSACRQPCQRWLRIAERVQVAVGRDMQRVKTALLGPDEPGPGLASSGLDWRLPADSKLVEVLGDATGQEQPDAILLVVDYRGNVVLAYPPGEEGPGVLNDLKRLLRALPR